MPLENVSQLEDKLAHIDGERLLVISHESPDGQTIYSQIGSVIVAPPDSPVAGSVVLVAHKYEAMQKPETA